MKTLRMVVASPGDVQTERKAVNKVAEELNHGIAADRNLRLEVIRWETDTYPGFHPEGPQGQVDTGLRIQDCDIFIGIFWQRFGTPVADAQSGTEHEFQIAYESWQRQGRPHIMFYFKDRARHPQSVEAARQLVKVKEFQEKYEKEGLLWRYTIAGSFETLLRTHLTRLIRDQYPLGQPASTKPPVNSSLPYGFNEMDWKVLRAIYDKALEDESSFLTTGFLLEGDASLNEREVSQSLEILCKRHYLENKQVYGTTNWYVRLTSYGWDTFAQRSLPDYQEMQKRVASSIISGKESLEEISQDADVSPFITERILDGFESQGWIKAAHYMGKFNVKVHRVSAELERWLESVSMSAEITPESISPLPSLSKLMKGSKGKKENQVETQSGDTMVRFNLHTADDQGQKVQGPFQMHEHDFYQFERAVERWKTVRSPNGGEHPFIQEDGTIELNPVAYSIIRYIERLS